MDKFHNLIKDDQFIIIPRSKNKYFDNRFKLNINDKKNMFLMLDKNDMKYLVKEKDFIRFGNGLLFVFKKNYKLIDLYGRERNECLYIKIKNNENNLPIISFHLDE